MRPARRGAPAVLRLPGWLIPSLLSLWLMQWCPHAAQGDCGIPPDIPNSTVDLENLTTFPVGFVVSYYCNPGFAKIIGKGNVAHCLTSGEWTQPSDVFCMRSCGPPPKVRYGHKKDIYIPVRYHPAGFVMEYDCKPGHARNYSIAANITCLQNYTWSKLGVFCYKRSCPDPGKIENGHISTPNGTLFASFIYFSCNPGYKLVGENSTYCYYEENDMVWGDPFPECQEIPTTTQKPTTMDVKGTKAPSTPPELSTVNVPAAKSPSTPPKPTTVKVPAMGALSTHQKPTTVNIPATKSQSTPPKPSTVKVPAMEAPSTHQKQTTVNIPGTKSPSTPPKPTTVNIPATKSPSTPQKPTTVNVPATETPLTPQKPTTVNIPSMEATPTLQNLTTRNSSTTKALPIHQKPALTVVAMDAPPTSQKPITASDSATVAKTSPVSKALSTETHLTVQTFLMTNSSATRATPKTHSFTTAKASYAQTLPVTQKLSTVHVPMTKGLHTTQRLSSAHIAATKNKDVFPPHSTSRGNGFLTAGLAIIGSGFAVGTIIIASIIIKKISRNYGRSGSYYLHENSKAHNVMFQSLTETGGASEV